MACDAHNCNVCRFASLLRGSRRASQPRTGCGVADSPTPAGHRAISILCPRLGLFPAPQRRPTCQLPVATLAESSRAGDDVVMKLRFDLAVAISSLAQSASAETMVTSHYRARSPEIAAHRTLPLGTRLLVTNPRTGRSVRIVIGTRGPFVRGRALDISHQRARDLGFGRSGVLRLGTRVVSD
jgi:Lytic transglycolase